MRCIYGATFTSVLTCLLFAKIARKVIWVQAVQKFNSFNKFLVHSSIFLLMSQITIALTNSSTVNNVLSILIALRLSLNLS